MARTLLALSIAVISLAAGSPARAQNIDAEALFTEGDTLMKQGKIVQACDAFEASNRLEPRAGTLIRLAECRERNQQLASAWSSYKDALTRVKDPRKRQIAEARVKALEAKLSYLTIKVPDSSRIDGLELARDGKRIDPALWNRALPVDGGSLIIVARAPKRSDWTSTVVVPAEGGKIVVDVPVLEPPRAATPPPVTPVPAPATQPPPEPRAPVVPTPSRWTSKRKIAVGVGGIAALGFVGGIVVGSKARQDQDAARALCPDPQTPCGDADRANTLNDDARGRAVLANVLFGVGGAMAIGAGVLWVTGAPVPGKSVAVVPGPASINVVGRF